MVIDVYKLVIIGNVIQNKISYILWKFWFWYTSDSKTFLSRVRHYFPYNSSFIEKQLKLLNKRQLFITIWPLLLTRPMCNYWAGFSPAAAAAAGWAPQLRLHTCLSYNLHEGFIFSSPLVCPSMVALICMSLYRHALTKWPHLHVVPATHVQSSQCINGS